MKKGFLSVISLLFVLLLVLSSCTPQAPEGYVPRLPESNLSLDDVPEYSGEAYVSVLDGVPRFIEEDYTDFSYEYYSPLDSLGRCGITAACIGRDIMPTEERGSIGSVKPTGWHTVKYDIVDGKYLYNRCHLIGFQLTGENANKQNLITGTRYLNIEGMLPFENMIADYVEETGNHVLFRVTPIFDGVNLVAHGVHMEAYSIEDFGEGICFSVFAYNVQPGITINYATGENYLSDIGSDDSNNSGDEIEGDEVYILNTSTKKYHKPTCNYANSMNEANKEEYTGAKEDLEADGYTACGTCKP